MQLGNHNTLGTVDNKCAVSCHVWDRAEEHILDDGSEILVVGVCAIEFQLGLQGHGVCEAAFEALLY